MQIKNYNSFLLLLIIAVGFILRAYNFFEIPFTHDEFSAFFRTKFDNISDLIAYGARIDGHPAGIQVFLYYWIQFFGPEEWVVKLPFLLFGTASIFLIYKIAKIWFNDTVGLLSASFMAVSHFAVMYSQIARPYISGLFFSLLMVWFWSKLIKKPSQKFWVNGIGFVTGASLCTYNHHFSMLFAVIVGISGLFLLQRKYILKYLLLGVLVFLLYIPHLEILFHQMSMKGVEGWLAKPNADFIVQFFRFVFNYSWWFLGLLLILVVIGYYLRGKVIPNKTYLLFSVFFFLPFLIGFFYSIFVSAVLQFSVLIFSFAFLYFLLIGHYENLKFKFNLLIVLSILSVGTLSLVLERKHYDVFYKSHFEHVLLDFHDAKNIAPEVPAYIDSRKDIIYYYADRHGLSTDFCWFDEFSSLGEVHSYVFNMSQKHDYFYLGVNSRFKSTVLTIVQEYFPYLVYKRDYFIGTHYLFSKNAEKNERINREVISHLDFKNKTGNETNWKHIKNEYLTPEGYKVDSTLEWSPTFEMLVDNTINHRNDFIEIEVLYKADSLVEKASLVTAIEKNDESIYWSSIPLKNTMLNNSDLEGEQKAFATVKMSDIKGAKNANLKVFIWNEAKENFTLKEVKIYTSKGNPIIYGLVEPI